MSATLNNKPKLKARLLRESHRRQFAGEDWQAVAVDLWQGMDGSDDEDFNFLAGSPDPGCECGFCATAPWRDDL